MTAPVVQSDTTHLYQNIPDYIQDWDSNNGYQLLLWLDGVCTMLQTTDDWARDDLTNDLVGWARLFDYSLYQNASTMDTVRKALIVLPWFAQFTGTKLSQIPNIVTSGLTDLQAAQKYAPYINNWITQITNINGFQRGTLDSFLNLFAIYLSNQTGTVVTKSQFQVLEKTNIVVNNPNIYITAPYSIVILVPSALIPSNTYASVFLFANGVSTQAYSYFQTGGTAPYNYSNYSNYPNSITSVQNFVNYNTPAGLSVTVLKN